MNSSDVGISGFALYVPPYRVDLEAWCGWTGNSWPKISDVVGRSFRMVGPAQNVYTMAATAAYRLIEQYDIDPERVAFLGLGTESSTDNSAGAIIVKGMLDNALLSDGRAGLSRNCQVPEYKHACLGGVYAMKDALRWLALGKGDEVAIVIAADIARYTLGSSGEPTQGAGAVAMLLERDPQLLHVDVVNAGSASAYRADDFRKPHYRSRQSGANLSLMRETPVFNGKYSVSCYIDETLQSLRDMFCKLGVTGVDYYRQLEAAFMHRPYQHMPNKSWALNYLVGLASDGAAGRAELSGYCLDAELDTQEVVDEMHSLPDVLSMTAMEFLDAEPYPLSMQLVRHFRMHKTYHEEVENKLRYGAQLMRDVGNIYAAALPAWMAAGLEEASQGERELAGGSVLALGYGSGDAAEALPMRIAEGWREAAQKIGFTRALARHQDLNFDQYYAIHETGTAASLDWPEDNEFLVNCVGCQPATPVANDGIEQYQFNLRPS